VTQIYDVPAGWIDASVSRKPLVLVNAFAFSKSANPPLDQWTHFAKLRPISGKLLIGMAVVTFVCLWGIVSMSVQYGEEMLDAWYVLVIFGFCVLFFGAITIGGLVANRKRTGWPGVHGLGIGESGISYRLAGADTDVPWEAVTAIEATVTNMDNGKAKIPVLRVEYAGTKVDLNTQILGASPLVMFWALTYYWRFPAARSELGTTTAQHRMDAWVASVTRPVGVPA
jgi:hypothetical protein